MATPYHFGKAELRPAERQLLLDGQPVNIGARAFDVLHLLVQEHHRVVGKCELLKAVWPGLVVEENNLQVQISTLRKVLGTSAITTIPGQGYQFTVPLRNKGELSRDSWDSHETLTLPPLGNAYATSMNRFAALVERRKFEIALAVAAIVGLIGWNSVGERSRPATAIADGAEIKAIDERSIAVLPFVDMSEKKDQEFFADGLSEEVLDRLSHIPEMHVVARTSAFSFKGKSDDIPTIARKLAVSNLLVGSVRKSGNQLRITAQLVRADNGYLLWSGTYNTRVDDVFRVQEEIANAVVKALKISLLAQPSTYGTGTHNFEAYTLYLQARSIVYRVSSRADWEKIVAYLEEALKLDPKYARAWAFLGFARSAQAENGYIPNRQGHENARRAVAQALALDSSLASAHNVMAHILLLYDWEWAGADDQIRQSLQLDPSNPTTVGWAGLLAETMGHPDQAVDLFRRSVQLDPTNAHGYLALGTMLYEAGRLDESPVALRKSLDLNPTEQEVHLVISEVMLAKGDASSALVEAEIESDDKNKQIGRALALFALGRTSEADAVLSGLESKFADQSAFSIAKVHAFRGEIDQSFAWLDRAFRQRDSDLRALKSEPMFRRLKTDLRYGMLLRRLKLPE
jgi:adenylate cyclase